MTMTHTYQEKPPTVVATQFREVSRENVAALLSMVRLYIEKWTIMGGAGTPTIYVYMEGGDVLVIPQHSYLVEVDGKLTVMAAETFLKKYEVRSK